MLKYDRKSLKNNIGDIFRHLMANGKSQMEYRLYYDISDGELMFHSSIGSNWSVRNNNLKLVSKVSQNVDLEEWFELPCLYDEDNNRIGVWWDDDPEDAPFTKDDFFTEVFQDFVHGLFDFETEYYDPEKDEPGEISDLITAEEENKLYDDINEILLELRNDLQLDNEEPILRT